MLQPIDSLKDVHNCLQIHLNRYNEEFGNVYLDINLSENVIAHIVKLHRVLSYHHGLVLLRTDVRIRFSVNCSYSKPLQWQLLCCSGNFLLIGPIGSHLGTLCKLALHVADIAIHFIDTSKQNTFLDGLRSAVRISGAEGKKLTVFFTVSTFSLCHFF